MEEQLQFALRADNRKPGKDKTADDQPDAGNGDLYRDLLPSAAKENLAEDWQFRQDQHHDEARLSRPDWYVAADSPVHLASSGEFQVEHPTGVSEILSRLVVVRRGVKENRQLLRRTFANRTSWQRGKTPTGLVQRGCYR
ncbi:MAG: hypothetical protein MZU79_01195 [Anaerotruncus sp.]|nr:hypothetical protein [Anaerotruncus sp.]